MITAILILCVEAAVGTFLLSPLPLDLVRHARVPRWMRDRYGRGDTS